MLGGRRTGQQPNNRLLILRFLSVSQQSLNILKNGYQCVVYGCPIKSLDSQKKFCFESFHVKIEGFEFVVFLSTEIDNENWGLLHSFNSFIYFFIKMKTNDFLVWKNRLSFVLSLWNPFFKCWWFYIITLVLTSWWKM